MLTRLPVGDEVIRAMTAIVRDSVRATDCAGRYGGGEFAIILTGMDTAAAFPVAQRIRETIAATPVLLSDGTAVSVTASIGIVIVAQARDCDIDTLLAAADTALYRAKDAGRNQVVLGDA